jgi:hypothetical protein
MCVQLKHTLFCPFSPSLSGFFEVSIEICHFILIPMATSWEKTNKHEVKDFTAGIKQPEKHTHHQ